MKHSIIHPTNDFQDSPLDRPTKGQPQSDNLAHTNHVEIFSLDRLRKSFLRAYILHGIILSHIILSPTQGWSVWQDHYENGSWVFAYNDYNVSGLYDAGETTDYATSAFDLNAQEASGQGTGNGGDGGTGGGDGEPPPPPPVYGWKQYYYDTGIWIDYNQNGAIDEPSWSFMYYTYEDLNGNGSADSNESGYYVDDDGDGLSNWNEYYTAHTDMYRIDSDLDGLTDGDEWFNQQADGSYTNPNNWDTDSDGICDLDDIHGFSGVVYIEGQDFIPPSLNNYVYRHDYDGDGLPNYLDGLPFRYSELGQRDNDDDGLFQDEEISLGTSDMNDDSDGDGLSDFAEVRTHHTNPTLRDSDDDGLTDHEE